VTIEIYGNTSGLAPSAVKSLERIYRRRVPPLDISTPELTRSLVEAAVETGRQVGALVHRSGEVDYVIVGDAGRLMLPDIGRLRAAQGRFRGLRLVHVHGRGEPLTHDDLVDLVRLRLDLVAVIQLAPSGEPRSMMYAYNVPVKDDVDGGGAPSLPYREVGPLPIAQAHLDVGRLMGELEAEFARSRRARKVKAKDGRALLIHVGEKSRGGNGRSAAAAEESVQELRELARSAGTDVADVIVQHREKLDPKFVMGKGKLDEVILRAMQLDAETLIFDRELTPAQASAIAKQSDLKVIDRTQLILDIFAQRAESRDGKLQVELAQLKYSLPRLGQKDDSLSRLTGGIGGRGPGETTLEIGRRRARDRVNHLEKQLLQLGKQRATRRRKRTREGVKVVAIVGYTNAGKSTLLNTLARSDVVVEDKLFATLDTRSRQVSLTTESGQRLPIVLTDTVGFIRDLPKDLFAAFRATFEEAADADLLLHVVDASDPALNDQIETTHEVLEELELDRLPRVLVFNKADRLEPAERARLIRATRATSAAALVISATDRSSLVPLEARIVAELDLAIHPEVLA
jgi:GTP-binding protein HflX